MLVYLIYRVSRLIFIGDKPGPYKHAYATSASQQPCETYSRLILNGSLPNLTAAWNSIPFSACFPSQSGSRGRHHIPCYCMCCSRQESKPGSRVLWGLLVSQSGLGPGGAPAVCSRLALRLYAFSSWALLAAESIIQASSGWCRGDDPGMPGLA